MLSEIKSSREGLLSISINLLQKLVRKDPISEAYDVEETPFARGKFATVRRASHRATGIHYAAKFIKKRRRAADQTKEIYHEIAVLLQCASSGRVVRLHEVYETSSDMVLILELAAGGELQRILEGDECLGELEAKRAMKQILEGLAFLHERSIAHLDLKPQNLLLTIENSCEDIKLCDFGISRVLEPGVEVRELIGTPDYVAPEVLSYEPISLATDVWSVGVLAYVLLTGYSPFGASDKQQTYLNISKCALSFDSELFEDISSSAIDFITSSLVVDPRKRPTVQQLLDHPWISHKALILPPITKKTSEILSVTPKSTPLSQRKTLPCVTSDTPKPQRKTYSSDSINGTYADSPTRTYNVSTNCLCPQCGTTCRHLPHTPVSKTPITVDRGILC
ncbi:hypothetical protein ILUMI_02029 [Ignelater luminosus]|uniref:non-specific serine/threonine protein kinase n=1 Tax=Ignelater luminosus TaxID=2038154 RepID=A0A8K0GGU7_IGNLU|nr:hypothetical protein ILUMI_02029 [Ignelater luminosus]